MKPSYTIKDLLLFSIFVVPMGLMLGYTLFAGRLPFTDPKFKVGDCITDKDSVGEFTITKSTWIYLIKKVGKESYLTDVYVRNTLVSENSETLIWMRDIESQVIDPSNCKVKE